jgi:serine/threonine protein kinase/Tfp pilus assembly protein PilF
MKSALSQVLQAQLFLEEHSELFPDTQEIRWPEPGEQYLDFQLKLELGKGAFARVFLATEPKLGNRLVAVKIGQRGGAEAEILGPIKHRNIVPVHSVREDKSTGLTAVCMPYAGSATLHDVLDKAFSNCELRGTRGEQISLTTRQTSLVTRPARARVILEAAKDLRHPLDPAQPAAPDPVLCDGDYVNGIRLLGAQLADALAFIHERGICHRDLKPSNVLMSPEGVPMLLDFNLCADNRRPLNLLGGTMAYMSPEQLRAVTTREEEDGARGETLAVGVPLSSPQPPGPRLVNPGTLDARSDIFSLGVILYQLATGTHPFGPPPLKLSGAAVRQYLLDKHQQEPTEARCVNPDVDSAFSQLIQRCLSYDPKDRPQTAAQIASDLRQQLARSKQRSGWRRIGYWLGRHPIKMLAAALLIAALGVGGISFAALRPPYSQRQLESGLRLYQQGQLTQAVRCFNDALQADPNNHAARFARARAFQQLGAFDKSNYNLAMQDFMEADQRNPDGRNKAALGYCLNRTDGRKEDAIEYYKAAIRSGFATAEVHNNLGFNYLKMSQKKEARESLDEAIRLNPDLQAAYHNRAYLVLLNAQIDQLSPSAKDSDNYRAVLSGIADADKAIHLDSASAELYYHAACLCATAARVNRSWVVSALQHREEAIRQGSDPIIRKDFFLLPVEKEATPQKLASHPFSEQPLPPTRRIVDPIKD